MRRGLLSHCLSQYLGSGDQFTGYLETPNFLTLYSMNIGKRSVGKREVWILGRDTRQHSQSVIRTWRRPTQSSHPHTCLIFLYFNILIIKKDYLIFFIFLAPKMLLAYPCLEISIQSYHPCIAFGSTSVSDGIIVQVMTKMRSSCSSKNMCEGGRSELGGANNSSSLILELTK